MGETEGTYRALQTPGTRLGAQTPAGVSTLEPGQTPTSAAAVRTPARLHIRVQLLDDTMEVFDVEPRCGGQALLTHVWRRLSLIECDYFGLEFQSAQAHWIWLEPMKPIVRQIRRPKNTVLRLAVKFFPPDPGQLQEEYTRYLFALQLKRDLLEERLTCTDSTAALLTSHLLQSEIGDYDEELDRAHLRAHEYLPGQERALEKILALHREHAGQTPAESDFQVLEIARKLEMYGIRFHTASDREGAQIKLAVSHTGVLVFQSTTKINTFNWSRLRKLSFKRKRFLVKLHPEAHGPYQDTLEFLLGSRDECKNFWKICVEHHTFFRLSDQPKPKARAVLFSRGSSFRYSGRTQKQLVDYVRVGGVKRTPYERRHSKTRVSLHTLTADLPRQSISFPEGMRTPASPSATNASSCSVPASPPAPLGPLHCQDRGGSLPPPPAPDAKRPATERSSSPDASQAQPPRPPALQPCQGLSVESPLPSPSAQKSPPSLSPASQVPLGPAEQGLSPVLSDAGGAGMDDQEEPRHECPPEDEAYFIAKEILTTEQTYLKDLEVITVWFRSTLVQEDAMPAELMHLLFSSVDPIYDFHKGFLHEVEQRLALWEASASAPGGRGRCRIGDILRRNMLQLKALGGRFQRLAQVLEELEQASRHLKRLEAVCREFELQKVCYLPLHAFLLKPGQRLLHYRRLLGRLCARPGPGDPRPADRADRADRADCRDALQAVTEVTSELQHSLVRLENLQKLTELQRDLVGIENLVAPDREFLREGCLHTLTKQGLQPRMFFLFSDVLLYTSRGASGTSRFRMRGLLPLRGMLLIVLDPPVEERQNEWPAPHCFTIYAAQKTVVVAARNKLPARAPGPGSSEGLPLLPLQAPQLQQWGKWAPCPSALHPEGAAARSPWLRGPAQQLSPGPAHSTQLEKEKWMQDLQAAIDAAKHSSGTALGLPGSMVCSLSRRSPDEVSLEQESEDARGAGGPLEGQGRHRANTTVHVCWHRSTSVSRADRSAAVENQLSGYLLRKFKNSSGWQKLWVVLTNFCLFFYKTHQDDYPLASLPLLGYQVSIPREADGIHKEHVFKLQFKSHIYFFRAESKYTFRRWMEVIEKASSCPGRARPPEEEA
ncbi:FERM, ARHGEF and pleckstrin domain-containing protein 2 isoform X1 [Camelus dromedarius]|uniref:FERM, ARHGEF and pleckstrin domain-containing protein 2 isoform X1 n=1 Tax=Camelus dromedarius TaxID=9838 RepID=UPI003119FF0E